MINRSTKGIVKRLTKVTDCSSSCAKNMDILQNAAAVTENINNKSADYRLQIPHYANVYLQRGLDNNLDCSIDNIHVISS